MKHALISTLNVRELAGNDNHPGRDHARALQLARNVKNHAARHGVMQTAGGHAASPGSAPASGGAGLYSHPFSAWSSFTDIIIPS